MLFLPRYKWPTNMKQPSSALPSNSPFTPPVLENSDCSICSKNYANSLQHTCNECSNRSGGIAMVTVFIVLRGNNYDFHLLSRSISEARRALGLGSWIACGAIYPCNPWRLSSLRGKSVTQVRVTSTLVRCCSDFPWDRPLHGTLASLNR